MKKDLQFWLTVLLKIVEVSLIIIAGLIGVVIVIGLLFGILYAFVWCIKQITLVIPSMMGEVLKWAVLVAAGLAVLLFVATIIDDIVSKTWDSNYNFVGRMLKKVKKG